MKGKIGEIISIAPWTSLDLGGDLKKKKKKSRK